MSVAFSISAWCAWAQSLQSSASVTTPSIQHSDNPDVSPIPPMLRRRLNGLGRAAASQVLALLDGDSSVPLVYCSRHGDIERTYNVLKELALGVPVSPMNFSLSVHNAVPGVLTIHTGSTAAVSSIAAGNEGLVPTLLEAAGMLSERCRKVICVLSDVPIPEIYRNDDLVEQAFAICFVLSVNEGMPVALDHAGPVSDAGPLQCCPLR